MRFNASQTPLSRRGLLVVAAAAVTTLVDHEELPTPKKKIGIRKRTRPSEEFMADNAVFSALLDEYAPKLDQVDRYRAKTLMMVWAHQRSGFDPNYDGGVGQQGRRLGFFGINQAEIKEGAFIADGIRTPEDALDPEKNFGAARRTFEEMAECGKRDNLSVLENLPAMTTRITVVPTTLYTWQESFRQLHDRGILTGPDLYLTDSICIEIG